MTYRETPKIVAKASEYPQRVSAAISTAITSLALSVIPMLQSFDVIDWTGEQTAQVSFFVGVAGAAIGGLLAAIRYGEKRTTPVSNPKTDSGEQLVPIPKPDQI